MPQENTERKKAEEELHRYEYMVSSSSDMMALLDNNYVYLAANDAYVKAFGKTKAELVGHTEPEIFGQEFFERVIKSNVQRCLAGNEVRYQDWFEFPANGRHYMDVVYIPYLGSDKNVIGFAVIARDDTELKRAEDELRLQSEITANLSEGIYLVRASDAIIVYTNPRFEEMFGYGPSEMIGKHVSIVNAPTDQAPEKKAAEITDNIRRTGAWRGEIGNIKKDGTRFWCYASVSLFDHPKYGQVMVAVHTDITARKRAEEALCDSEEKHRTLFETMAQGVVYQDASGNIISANPAAERILGLSIDQMQGRTSIDPRWRSIHEDGTDFPGETHPAMVALKTGRQMNDVIMGVFNPHDSLTRWININAVPKFKQAQKKPYQVYTTFEDITERKRAEDLLEQYSEDLEEMVEERTHELTETHEKLIRSEKLAVLGQFATGIAHDLKNTLNAINSAAYVLGLGLSAKNDTELHSIRILGEEVKRANYIIEGLLDFYKTTKTDLKETDIGRPIRELVDRISFVEDIEIVVELDKPIKALVDPKQIMRVFQNLIDNAVQAMPEGGTLNIRDSSKGGFIEITFADTGKGISPENLDKIFEPLFTTRRLAGGTGLGLAVCKSIVEAHNGTIGVSSEIGKGTTFTVRLPIN